jgi:hypothetical protein
MKAHLYRNHRIGLQIVVLSSFLICITYVHILTPHVMPRFHEAGATLADRLTSTSMGDSKSYGMYADELLKHRSFQRSSGEAAVKHMPGLPLILATTYQLSGSLTFFRLLQALFFFAGLYFFLIRLRDKVPPLVPPLTVLILTFHPLMVKLFTGIMSEVLFCAALLWVGSCLSKPDPSTKHFLAAGLLFGLAVYLRESALVFMGAVGLTYLVKDRSYFGRVALMGCIFLVVLSPWIVRNHVYTHEFIPLTTKSTSLFYHYSIPLTTELYSPLRDSYDYKKLRDVYSQNTAGSSAIKAAIKNYVTRPREQLVSTAIKTIALFNKPGLLHRPLSRPAKAALLLVNIGLVVFHVGVILFGVVLAFTKHALQFPYLPYLIAAQYLQALFFWSEPRYLMPLYPFLIIIALTWYLNHRPARSGRCSQVNLVAGCRVVNDEL